jgi:hypothetical protein
MQHHFATSGFGMYPDDHNPRQQTKTVHGETAKIAVAVSGIILLLAFLQSFIRSIIHHSAFFHVSPRFSTFHYKYYYCTNEKCLESIGSFRIKLSPNLAQTLATV